MQEVQRFAVRLCDSTEEFEYLCYDIRTLRAYLKSIGTDDASIESVCIHILKRKLSALSIIHTEFQLYHEAFLDGKVRVEAERPFWEEYPNENH